MIKIFTAIILAFCSAGAAAAQDGFSFAGIDGEWTGTLEYANYSDDKRVKMNLVADLKSIDNGNGIRIEQIFDDFGKIYRSSETHRLDRENGTYEHAGITYPFTEEDGKLTMTGTLEENGKPQPVRYTVTHKNDQLEFLKETRKPFQFRNRYLLRRAKHFIGETRTFSIDQLKEDIAITKRVLLELHPGIYRYNTPEEIKSKFDSYEAKLKRPMREDEFFKLFAQMISEVKCYHTYPNPIAQKNELKNGLFNRRSYFPFNFQIVERKMIITENASSKGLSRGSEITKINGIPVSEVLEQLLTATYADGNGTVEHRLQTLELTRFEGSPSVFDMIFPLFFPPKDKVYGIEAIDFKTKKKAAFEVLALTKAERSTEMEKRYGKAPTYDDDWKFEIWEDSTAYLKMDNFLAWRLSFKVEPFLAEAFKKIRDKGVENLIIDIRGSGGGYDGVYREIFRYLSQEPFPCRVPVKYYFKTPKADAELLKYASSWDPSFKENLAKGYPASIYRKAGNGLFELIENSEPCQPIQPYENNFKGKTYLLVSSNNASAAFTLPYYAKERNLATLVGQETGGNLRGFNGSQYLSFVLPNSKFEFDISLLASVIDPNAEDSGVIPDVYVEQQPDDIGNGIDRELEKAKKLIALNRLYRIISPGHMPHLCLRLLNSIRTP